MLSGIVICMIGNFFLIFYTGFRQIYILLKGIYVRCKHRFGKKKPRPTYAEFVSQRTHIKSAGML